MPVNRGMSAPVVRWAAAFALLASGGALGQDNSVEQWTEADHQRVVRVFDFHEPDNLGDVPKFWELFCGDSFPRYADGRFDLDVGRTAPPSFYLNMNGRNIAMRYRGIETRIRPNSDYLVVGYIRPNNLRTSRATITAYYLDHEGIPLPETQRQGRLIGGAESADDWHRVEVFLPAGPFEADALGLTLWVEQAEIWDPTPRPDHHIERADIRAGAWFDDILIYRLPQVTLTAPMDGNIFVAPRVPTLLTTVLDHDGVGLEAGVEVFNAAGALVGQYIVPVQEKDHAIALSDLEPGHYRARLQVTSGSHTLVDRWLSFAVLADIGGLALPTSQAFGVVLAGAERSGSDAEVSLISAAGLGAVKVPLWTGSAAHPGFSEDMPTLDAMLNELLRLRVDVTGVLGGLPPELANRDDGYGRTLIDILNDPVESWANFLAEAIAPYASVLASWQIGADGDPAVAADPRLADTYVSVREQMLTLMTSPYLTAPARADLQPWNDDFPADRISLCMPTGIHPDYIGEHLRGYGDPAWRLETYVAPPPRGYDRVERLSSWAKRIIETSHTKVDTVYVPQPWQWRHTVAGPVVEPTEDYVIFRTIALLLGNAQADGVLAADEGVRALLFSHGSRSVLAVWDQYAPPEGRPWNVQLGETGQVIDLWGRVTPLERTDDGSQRIMLTSVPVFVDGLDRWVPEFQQKLRLLPETVAFTLAPCEHLLHIANPSRDTLVGSLKLELPDDWRAQPHKIEFAVPPGAIHEFPIEVRYSHNEPAGDKTLMADVRLFDPVELPIRVPLRFHMGIPDVDVWGFATVEGDRVVIRHGVRNRTEQDMSFRVHAAAPGRDRQHKIIIGLAPGETIVREYRFERAEELIGRSIRVGLREVNGPRIHNLELQVQ